MGLGVGDREQMKKGVFNHDPVAQFRARTLRADKTAGEKILWAHLRKKQQGYGFRQQVRVGTYILDFYCARAKLCVEVDGEQHQGQVGYDSRRDATLGKLGIQTMRIPSIDLFDPTGHKLSTWVRAIAEVCEERAAISTPQPPSSLTNQSEEGGL
jgi:very-short-patch-repair endonuclease